MSFKGVPRKFHIYIASRHLDIADELFSRLEQGEVSSWLMEAAEIRLDQEGRLPYETTLRRIIREEIQEVLQTLQAKNDKFDNLTDEIPIDDDQGENDVAYN